jgi:hypothetical protein
MVNCFLNPQRTKLNEASGNGRGIATKLNTRDSGWWNPANFSAEHWHVTPGYYPQIRTMVESGKKNVKDAAAISVTPLCLETQ